MAQYNKEDIITAGNYFFGGEQKTLRIIYCNYNA